MARADTGFSPPRRSRPLTLGRLAVTALTAGLVAAGFRRDAWPSDAEERAAARDPGRGRRADSPAEIPARGWRDIFWRVYAEIANDRLVPLAAGVAFFSLLAIFPAIAALVAIFGLFADPQIISQQLDTLAAVLPADAIQVLREQIERLLAQNQRTLGLTFLGSLGVSLWTANSGMKALIDALNIVYDEPERRGFIKLNAMTLLFTLAAIGFLISALVLVVVLPIVLGFVGLAAETETLLRLARWPLILVFIWLALTLVYRYGPSRERAKWRWLSLGSAVASVVWIAGSMLFSWYVTNFGSYNRTYGSLGAVIAFMVWIWLSAIVVLIGAELDAETEHQTARDTTSGPEAPMGLRGAAMADRVGPVPR